MNPLTEAAIRRSMVNCSRSEAAAMTMPKNLSSLDWEASDFLGWRDPRAPQRGYLVQWRDGEPLGLMLRAPESRMSHSRAAMCALCHYGQSADNVALFTARRAGQRGREGNTVGTYICADLACPVNVRSGGAPSAFTSPSGRPRPVEPSAAVEEAVRRRVAELGERLAAFTDSVLRG
jgi:hypothetical protein